jgi:hypothetical protein
MAGRGTISVNQTPTYGDKSKLAAASKTLTKTPMTGTPTPAPTAGRPVSTGAGVFQTGHTQQPQPEVQAPPAIPAEHQSKMDVLAQAYRTKQFWDNVLANYPSEWSRMYAADANKALAKATADARTQTPFFE